uniref:Uncharacterized protein n=1 Tax=Physcomitrium patens TaxID=3218 RepID=A0A2K1JYU0_PHYPA|nr:hypothetical protein PHYPA_013813 [Physcomitrium patens]
MQNQPTCDANFKACQRFHVDLPSEIYLADVHVLQHLEPQVLNSSCEHHLTGCCCCCCCSASEEHEGSPAKRQNLWIEREFQPQKKMAWDCLIGVELSV